MSGHQTSTQAQGWIDFSRGKKSIGHVAKAHDEHVAKNGAGAAPHDTSALRKRYHDWASYTANELHQGLHAKNHHGYDWIVGQMQFNMSTQRSPVIDAKLDRLAHSTDPNEQKDLAHQLDVDLGTLERYTEELFHARGAQEGKGPSTMDSLVEGVDMSVRQVKGYAEQAHRCYTAFVAAHQQFVINLKAAEVAIQHTYGDLKKLKAAYDFGKHYYEFATTVAEKQALAAESGAVLGPVGPIAGELAIMAELVALLAEMIDVIGGLCDVFVDILTGKNAMPKEIETVSTVKTVFEGIHKVLDGIEKNAKPLVEIGRKINRLLGRKK